MKQDNVQNQITSIEKLIREGHPNSALINIKSLISKVKWAKVSIELRIEVARLCMRAEAPLQAVRLLHPIVRSEKRQRIDLPESALAEYAFSLNRIGAEMEANKILSELTGNNYPRALLYNALNLFRQWRYKDAIPILHRYLQVKELSSYDSLVGRVNLAAALTAEEKFEEGRHLLTEILAETEKQQLHTLYNNSLEILTQIHILSKNWKEAELTITSALQRISNQASLSYVFINKWKAISEFLKNPSDKAAVASVMSARTRAFEINQWESVRHLDLVRAKHQQNKELFKKLYFGTPHLAYKNKVLIESGLKFDDVEDYIWQIYSPTVNTRNLKSEVIDLYKYDFKNTKVFRLFCALCSDFYRPMTLPQLFEKVYPGNFFHIIHSTSTMHQLFFRLRQSLKELAIPVVINEVDGLYSLRPAEGSRVDVLTYRHWSAANETEANQTYLLKHLEPRRSYTTSEISTIWELERRTALRRINELCAKNALIAVGAGKNKVYMRA